ncbi:uncharacterized protein [Ptychodera flava]|uniref:uncharacterized protein n=1 Tax=Ptychodera flava TaxID=63121 RepID=UPI00396A7B34
MNLIRIACLALLITLSLYGCYGRQHHKDRESPMRKRLLGALAEKRDSRHINMINRSGYYIIISPYSEGLHTHGTTRDSNHDHVHLVENTFNRTTTFFYTDKSESKVLCVDLHHDNETYVPVVQDKESVPDPCCTFNLDKPEDQHFYILKSMCPESEEMFLAVNPYTGDVFIANFGSDDIYFLMI